MCNKQSSTSAGFKFEGVDSFSNAEGGEQLDRYLIILTLPLIADTFGQ